MSRNKDKKKGGRGKQRGRDRSNSARNSNKSTTIPIEKLRFTIGDNQAENYARLIEYLAEQVLEEYGRKMAYILENEKEYDLKEPKLQSVAAKDDEGKDITAEEKTRQTEENKMKYDSQLKEHSKELKEYTRNKERLCAVLLKKTSQLMRRPRFQGIQTI